MNNQKTLFRSKTININAALVAVFTLLAAFGVTLPDELKAPEAVAAFVAIINIILRLFTNTGLKLKEEKDAA